MISRSLLLVLLVLACLQSFTTAQSPKGPDQCCFGFQNKSIPVRVIASYRVTDLQCTKHGVIFTLKNGGQRCGDPSVEWVKDRMDNINQRLFNNQTSTEKPDKPVSTASSITNEPDKPVSTASPSRNAKPTPTVRVNPQSSVYTGDTVTLSCELQQETGWEFLWYRNNQLQSLNSEQENTLKVTVVNAGEREYKCQAIRGNYSTWNRDYYNGYSFTKCSNPVKITVRAKPTPTVRVNPQSSVYTGDTVTLSCELQQGTGWGFLWYRNNQLQNLNSEQENTLKVTVVNAGEREYKCQATRGNYSTEFSDPVKITVRDYNPNGPETCCVGFQNKSIPVRVIASYRVTDLQCTKHGVIFTLKNGGQRCGDPSVEWVKDRMDNINQRLFNN
ncbi:uncharacterized protein LOC131355885 isoform X6 [Hemibagrus wyckioides]|uniref:uncharacterized protein LOC131355885 isoform X6 n=1 Tax=Hemibagrus wyckioides TaxID=337641 RepID=UPI00266BC08B|nr:uncharacterized protein LOC131355885 isoform X6 [Hemibagrus wyckioides]